jgi:hypothetical protein
MIITLGSLAQISLAAQQNDRQLGLRRLSAPGHFRV